METMQRNYAMKGADRNYNPDTPKNFSIDACINETLY